MGVSEKLTGQIWLCVPDFAVVGSEEAYVIVKKTHPLGTIVINDKEKKEKILI